MGCKEENSYMEQEKETVDYTFGGFKVSQANLDYLSTRSQADEATYSLLVVDVKDGAYVQSVSRIEQPESEALADVTLPLRVGQHTIYILCSAQPWHNFDETSLLVNWNEQTASLGDVWTAAVTVTVQSGDAQSKAVTLNRAVAYVRTVLNDALPSNLATFRQTLVGGSWSFNLVQQSGDVAAQVGRTSVVPASYAGLTNVGVGIYTFVPSGASVANSYTITALDSDETVMQQLTFTSVPLCVNQYTTYQGNFFGYGTAFSVVLQTDWLEPKVISF